MDTNRMRSLRSLAVVALLTAPMLTGCHLAHGAYYAPSHGYGLYYSPGYSHGHHGGHRWGHHRGRHRGHHRY